VYKDDRYGTPLADGILGHSGRFLGKHDLSGDLAGNGKAVRGLASLCTADLAFLAAL